MRPRSFWGTFATILGVIVLPFAVFWSLLYSLMMGLDFGRVLQDGVLTYLGLGTPFGLIMAFLLKTSKISIPIQERESFVTELNTFLARFGYHLESKLDDLLTYKPSFRSGLLAGRISIQMNGSEATIVGPLMYTQKLEKWIQQ